MSGWLDWCYCDHPHKGGLPEPTAWLWYGRNGYVTPLCDPCFHRWMRNAADDPDLGPGRYHAARRTRETAP